MSRIMKGAALGLLVAGVLTSGAAVAAADAQAPQSVQAVWKPIPADGSGGNQSGCVVLSGCFGG